ncbi:MAG: hypothetical protein JSS55_05065 [Proteobacteria bacterium]|jgi:hypothetical protein|nr:hypothetical protein [Pseudomonadota bacterium]
MTLVRFYPQAWVNDYAMAVDPEGETLWDVGDVAAGLKSNSDETDGFRDHPNAPDWVREWRGPYYIEMLCDTAVD